MRPKKPETTGEGDLFRARFDRIIHLKHEQGLLVAFLRRFRDRDLFDAVRLGMERDQTQWLCVAIQGG
ncbi:hypothetical protein [Bradyrhizobium uaiense]|uniref:Uncharacterized protein n=1 Tax=Bradyrhizobium uaiense TaxID=2594946 RepID=A0A6P1BJS8_9BRAD|nr:hypothetical protein [Bradyrhizobium uaiense]NEU97890.1 hypothetical protein [Bradyrhizobium uaiense]